MKIQLKHSDVVSGSTSVAPAAEYLLDGELAVAFNSFDPKIFFKTSDDTLVYLKAYSVDDDVTAVKLDVARTITLTGDVTGSFTFDGSTDISFSTTVDGGNADTLEGSNKAFFRNASNINTGILPSARLSGTYNISNAGNSTTATRLETGRSITLTGDVAGTATFDGTSDIDITATVADNSHNHTSLTGITSLSGSDFSLQTNVTNVADDGTSDSPYSRLNIDSLHSNGLGVGQSWIEGSNIDFNTTGYIGTGQAGGQTHQTVVINNPKATVDGSTTSYEIYHDNYHPIADSLTSSVEIALIGDVTGSVSFDGSTNVNISTTVDGGNADTLEGSNKAYYRNASNLNAGIVPTARLSGTYNIDTTGNAATATALETSREIRIRGDVTGEASFDGTEAITIDVVIGGSNVVVVGDQVENSSGNWHTFVNDGGGNIGQRWNSTKTGTNRLVEDGHAWELQIDNDSANGSFILSRSNTSQGLANNIISWIPAVTIDYQGIITGKGNGLTGVNADLLDGLNSTSFLRSDVNDTTSGNLTVEGVILCNEIRDRSGSQLILNAGEAEGKFTGQTGERIYLNSENGLVISTPDSSHSNFESGYTQESTLITGNYITVNGNNVWHEGNDGAGSGLDADTVDSLQASSFLRSDQNDTFTGTITGNTLLLGGSQIISSSAEFQVNGFMRTGTIYLHQGNAADANENRALSNNAGVLQWDGNRIITSTGGEINGQLVIDSDNHETGALRIENNVTDTNNNFYFALEIAQSLSGSQAVTADRSQGGIFLDINSTNTGGDTSNEHRAYGIYVDLDSTGDSNLVYGIYSNATTTPSTGTVSNVVGGYFFAEDNGGSGQVSSVYGIQSFAHSDNSTSDINNQYGGYFKAYCAADSAAVGAARGVYSEIEINGTTDLYGTCFAYQAEIDNNTNVAQSNTTYLFYGNYSGTLPTTAYGVYIVNNVANYFGGSIESAGNYTISNGAPTIKFNSTVSGEDDFWIHVNDNNFYVLVDRDANGSWDSPNALQLEGDTNRGYLFGSRIFNDGYHPNADTLTTARTISLTGDVTGSTSFNGSANVSITAVVANDSHNHAFNNLTGKTSGTGVYSTDSHLVAGRGSGGVALTINDGYGNANVTFNHQNGTPEQTGRAGRIEVNTDSTSGDAFMYFELGNATANTAAGITNILTLSNGTSNFTSSAGLTFDNRPAFNGGTSGSTSPFTVDSTQVVTNLNADLLDGQQGSYYRNASNINAGTIDIARLPNTVVKTSGNQSISDTKTFTGAIKLNDNNRINFGTSSSISLRRDSTNLILDIPNNGTFFIRDTSGTAAIKHAFNPNGNYTAQGTVTANLFSGDGSSLTSVDADTVDGINSSSFLRSDANDTFTGTLTAGQNGKIAFPDNTTVPDVPTNQQHDYITFGANGSISQISGRGALLFTSSDDSMVIANGDVGRGFTNSNINVSSENIYLCSDNDLYVYTDLQEGWGTQHTLRFSASGILTVNGNRVLTQADEGGFLQNYYETAINSPDSTSGSWTTNSNSSWGDPKFNNTYDQYRWADGSAYVQYNIPSGYKSCWISQLQWSSGGYADCYGVQSDGGLVFLKRINTRQAVENTNEGNPDQHDGSTITHIGSGLDHFTAIRIQNRVGRIHLTGIAWTKNDNAGYEGTGMIHPAQISHQGSGSGLNADTLDGINSGSFLRSDAIDVVNAAYTEFGGSAVSASEGGEIRLTSPSGQSNGATVIDMNGVNLRFFYAGSPNKGAYLPLTSLADGVGSRILTTSDEGSGKGLDADTLDGVQASSFLRSNAADTFSGDLTSSGSARILLKKTDNNVSDHIQFYNGTTRVGEIGCHDTSWLRINQVTAANIYTPRYIRADGGFFVDGDSKGINGSGNFVGGTIAGASDYGTLLRSNADDIYSNGTLTIQSHSNEGAYQGWGIYYSSGWKHTNANAWGYAVRNNGSTISLKVSKEAGTANGAATFNDYVFKGSGNAGMGINATPSGTFATRNACIALGDGDTGIAQNGDGQLELWANNQECINVTNGGITSYKNWIFDNNNQTGQNNNYEAVNIDADFSGTAAFTTNRSSIGLKVDFDNAKSNTTSTNGNRHTTSGIYITNDNSQYVHDARGLYAFAKTTGNGSGVGTQSIFGAYTYAQAYAAGGAVNAYGIHSIAYRGGSTSGGTLFAVYGRAQQTTDGSGKSGNARGGYFEVQCDEDTIGDARGVESHIDRNSPGTITTGYLYYGSYSGTVGTKYGIYLTGETTNYMSGGLQVNNLAVGTASPAKCSVSSSGALLCAGITSTSTMSVSRMATFSTNMSSQDDWVNSPISIRERGLAGAGDGESRDAPNLNFHWSGRVSNSFWMNGSGNLGWGSYDESGVPSYDGTFTTANVYATGLVSTSQLYADTAIFPASNTEAIRVRSSSYSTKYLYIGGWSSANSDNIARIRTSGNLHIDSPKNGDMYLNWYSTKELRINGNARWQDNKQIRLGSGADFTMLFNGADTVFRNYAHANGDIIFQGETSAGTNQNILIMKTDSTRTYNILYENNGERFRTTSYGTKVNGNLGVKTDPGNSLAGRSACIAIGDSDTGIAQNGDGKLELWANNAVVMRFQSDRAFFNQGARTRSNIQTGLDEAGVYGANNVMFEATHGTTSGGTALGGRTYIRGNNAANTTVVFEVKVGTNNKIRFRADGNGLFDGGADIGNADYAEYFEWEDGNPDNEDRRGMPVVLVEDKIRIALTEDDPNDIIGVISAAPGVVGDSAEMGWHKQYLTDEYGSKVTNRREYLIWNNEETDPQPHNNSDAGVADQRREITENFPNDLDDEVPSWAIENNIRGYSYEQVINPDYDLNRQYIPRSERPEWDTVGLMGKLIIRNGMPVNQKWKRMKTINDSLSKWLVM